MKKLLFIIFLLTVFSEAKSQKLEVSGKVTDSTNGGFVIEIVVNDTLNKIMTDPKHGRSRYLKLYHNPDFVVRTDSTGLFKVRANPSDSLFFKSYGHKTKSFLVSDLAKQDQLQIKLERDQNAFD